MVKNLFAKHCIFFSIFLRDHIARSWLTYIVAKHLIQLSSWIKQSDAGQQQMGLVHYMHSIAYHLFSHHKTFLKKKK